MDVLLDWDKNGKRNPLLQTQCCSSKNPSTINTETVGLFLSACSVEAFNFTLEPCMSKRGHDHIFKATGLVLSKRESTRL